MSRTIKFSEFSLPTNGTSDLYLVGYVEGEENTNVKISANDLSFSASGSAGVSSVNGKTGLIQIYGENGVTVSEDGNTLILSGQNITIDQTFDETSQNPQSGAAIASLLENVAKTDEATTFKNDLIVWGDADLKWIYGQRMTINGTSTFNGNVIIEGRNASNILGSFDSHIADYFIHVTPEDKEYWNGKVDSDTISTHIDSAVNSIKENTDSVIHGDKVVKSYSTYSDGDTLDNATGTGIQYSAAHLISGKKFISISIPYTYRSDSEPTGYLVAEVCDSTNERLIIAYSDNSFAFTSEFSEAVFNFSDFDLPENYQFIRFALVSDTTVEPDFTSGTNCLSFRMKPIGISGSFTFDDDDCLMYNGSSNSNWLIASTITYETYEGGIMNALDNLEERVYNLETEEPEPAIYEKVSIVPTLDEIPTNDGELNAVHVPSSKVPHNIRITSVEMPIAGNTTSTPLYLVCYIVSSSDTKTKIGRSSNAVTVSSGITAKWDFEQEIIVPDGSKIEFFIATENSTINDNNVSVPGVHINCYQLGSGSGSIRYGANWYSRDVYLRFYTLETPLVNEIISEIISDAETHITKEEADVTYLSTESSATFAKLAEDNTFTANNDFTGTLTVNGAQVVCLTTEEHQSLTELLNNKDALLALLTSNV